MQDFRSFRIHMSEDKSISAGFEQLSVDDLTEGDVVIKVSHSTINYKDALAATGKGRILRKYPLNGGIDLAGTVAQSADSRFKEGDSVLVVGCGLSEVHDGGYSEYARLPGDCVVPMPSGLSEYQAMAFGTAGFTAAIAVIRMEDNGQIPIKGTDHCYRCNRWRRQFRDQYVCQSRLRSRCTVRKKRARKLPE